MNVTGKLHIFYWLNIINLSHFVRNSPHFITLDEHVHISVGCHLPMLVLMSGQISLGPVFLRQSVPGWDEDLEDGADHQAVDGVQGEGEEEQLLAQLDLSLQDWVGDHSEETVLREQHQLQLGQQEVTRVQRALQGPDCSLQDIRVNITANIVLDEGLRLPDDLHHELQGLVGATALAPPEQGPVLTEVVGAVQSRTEEGAVESPELSGV